MTTIINFSHSNIEWHARNSQTQIFSIIGYGDKLPVSQVPPNTDQIKVIVKNDLLDIEETSSILSWPAENSKFDYIFKHPDNNCRFVIKGLVLQGNAASTNARDSIGSYLPLNSIDDYVTISGDINIECAIVDPITYEIWEETGGVFPQDFSPLLLNLTELAVYDMDEDIISISLGCNSPDPGLPKIKAYFPMGHIEDIGSIRIIFDYSDGDGECYLVVANNTNIDYNTFNIPTSKSIGIGNGISVNIPEEQKNYYRLQNGNLFAGWFSVGVTPSGYLGPGGLTSFEIPIQGTDFYLEVAQSVPGELLSIVLAVKNGCSGGDSAYNIDCSSSSPPQECTNIYNVKQLNYNVGDVVFPDDPTDGYFRIGWQSSMCSSIRSANCYSGPCSYVQNISMPTGLIFLAFWIDPFFEQISFRMNEELLTYNISINSLYNENPKLIFGKHSNYENPMISPSDNISTPPPLPIPPCSYFANWIIYNNANMITTYYLDWLYNSGTPRYINNTQCWPNPGTVLEE